MDPVAQAVEAFRASFRRFLKGGDARVLRVVVDPTDLGALAQTIRGEEWHPENRSPFLVFTMPYEKGGACLSLITGQLYQHYGLMTAGIAKEGVELEPLGQLGADATAFQQILLYLARWVERTASLLAPPLFCWLPATVEDEEELCAAVEAFLTHAHPGIRFVLADGAAESPVSRMLTEKQVASTTVEFRIDQGAMQQHFAQMMLATPRKGRAPGAPPGAATPDVEPPPRPGPRPASDEQVRATLKEQGLPPVLTAGEGEELQRLVFTAAQAVSKSDAETALAKQYDAYQLCERAGVKLEQGMMAMVLAGYLVQFQQEEQALQWFAEAARHTEEAEAKPQLSQALMGLAYVHLQAGRYEEAGAAYDKAAAAAAGGEATLLALENLRMRGVCLQQLGRTEEGARVWMDAVQTARAASPGEIAASNFESMVGELKAALSKLGLRAELDWVDAVEHEITAERAASNAEASEGVEAS